MLALKWQNSRKQIYPPTDKTDKTKPQVSSSNHPSTFVSSVSEGVNIKNSDFEALAVVSDDDLALAVAAFVSPYIAASQVREAWDSLTPAEMVAIPAAPFKRAKDLPTDTIPELIAWRDAWLNLIRAAQNSDKTARGQQ